MRIIKLGLISLVVFSFLITGISLFFPSRIRISKATDIRASRGAVLLQVSDVRNWKNWYPGADTLELLLRDGQATGLLADNLQGAVSITSSSDSSVTAAITGPGVRTAVTGWNFFDGYYPDIVTVQWYMDFRLRWYPWEKFSSLLLEKRYGSMMEQGMDALKTFLEK